MKQVVNDVGIETRIFAETFEHEAYAQVKRLANFGPYRYEKIRIMPDAHAGAGCTVGTTMTITDKVTPNLVGVDIGCGMLAVKLEDDVINLEKLDAVINKYIPSGFNVHQQSKGEFDLSNLRCKSHVDLSRASLSIGSLGGGNHFIEVGRDNESGELWLVIHSGSRKLGGDVCKYYQEKAFQYSNKTQADKDLAYLEGEEFDNYMNDMKITQLYASKNRETMANIILRQANLGEQFRFETIHNYIDFSRMILRKGAVSAENNQMLLIPINMRDGSLLCLGKGNPDWNYSAPHGAGRLMSRSAAKKNIDMDEFTESMSGIYSTSISAATLDEAPQAYKPMDEILDAIHDSVFVNSIIKTIYNFKAH